MPEVSLGAPTSMNDDQSWIMLFGLLLSMGWTARLIYAHVEPHVWHDRQDRWVLAMCFVAYVVAWIPTWLLPFDFIGMQPAFVERKRCAEIAFGWLQFFWFIIYIANLALGYLTYDFARGYLDAGGFTIRRRLKIALDEIRVWYSWAAVIVVIPILGIAFVSNGVFDGSLYAAD